MSRDNRVEAEAEAEEEGEEEEGEEEVVLELDELDELGDCDECDGDMVKKLSELVMGNFETVVKLPALLVLVYFNSILTSRSAGFGKSFIY